MTDFLKPSRRETVSGIVFLMLWALLLPSLFTSLNECLPRPMGPGMLNFLFYSVSFLCAVLIIREFLRSAFREAWRRPLPVLGYAALGFLGNLAAGQLLSVLFSVIIPGFENYNDQTVILALEDAPVLMTLGTVLLVPVTEELLFRGAVFQGLYPRSTAAAYGVSIAAFAAVHVAGYAGVMEPVQLLLSLLQYLPAGFLLALACRRGGIVSAMLMHALVNGFSIFLVLR